MVGGHGLPEGMDRCAFDACSFEILLYSLLNGPRAHRPLEVAQKERGVPNVNPYLQIRCEGFTGLVVEGDVCMSMESSGCVMSHKRPFLRHLYFSRIHTEKKRTALSQNLFQNQYFTS